MTSRRRPDRPTSWWDEAYEGGMYELQWDAKEPSPELVALVAAGVVLPGGVVLDIGCGGGREAIWLARAGFRAIGVDVSERGLAIARARAAGAGATVDWRLGSALALPVADASVDLACDRGCLHHVAEADRPRYAAELWRVLRPGGRALIRGNADDPEEFELVTETSIDRHFRAPLFARGPVVPVPIHFNVGAMRGALVVLTRLG
jgi:SAM-dependent methyltransferase